MDPKSPTQSPGDPKQKPATRPPAAPSRVDAPGKTRELLQAPPKLELPKGGGAVRGIGEKFQANPVTGTGAISVPIALSPGRRGFQPGLALSYDSGAGNGPFGLGWAVGIPRVQRKTERGLPRYRDALDSDTFVLSDAEDLVPYLEWNDPNWEEPTLQDAIDGSTTWVRRRYRPRNESAIARIERWTDSATGEVQWRTWTRENVRRIYGPNADSQLIDPDNAGRIFAWYLQEERDELGNLIRYEYATENRLGVESSAAEDVRDLEKNGCTYLYIKRILYGNVTPFTDTGGWLFELVFDYGDHSGDPDASTPTAPGHEPDLDWPVREDVTSSFRSGFDVRCYRLCQRILMFHRLSDPLATTTPPLLVRSTELSHASSAIATTLSSVTHRGWSYDTSNGWSSQTLPALSFTYSAAVIDSTVQALSGVDDLPQGIDMSRWQWIDLDGEGLSGLLSEHGGSWFYKRNNGAGELGAIHRLNSRPSHAQLGAGGRLMDLDGDGRQEVVSLRPGSAGFFGRDPDGTWQPFRPFRQLPNVDWDDPNLRLVDLDGDGRPDVLLTEDDCFTWYPSEGREGWSESARVHKPQDEDLGPRVLFSSERESIFLADMSGDGLTDLVRIRNGSICYWPNRGYGHFGAKVQMARAPWFDAVDRFDPRRVRLADIDGCGPADILYVGPSSVRIWSNECGNAWSETATELPQFPGVGDPTVVSVADLLGEGTACLVWASPLLRDAWQPLRFVSLMGEGKPYLLKTITNNLGRVTTLTYAPSTQFYVADREAGTPWATKLPFPVQLIEQVEVRDDVTGWRIATRYAYHHGYYDSDEREFRGFGKVEQWDVESLGSYESSARGADAALDLDPVRTVTWFHTGAWRHQGTLESAYSAEYWAGDGAAVWVADSATTDAASGWSSLSAIERREAARALKGKAVRQEIYAEDGVSDDPYAVSVNSYTVVRIQARAGEQPAAFLTVPRESMSRTYERVAGDPRTQHTMTLAYDQFGTVTEQAAVNYPRRTAASPTTQQSELTVTISKAGFIQDTSDIDAEDDPEEMRWHLAVPWMSAQWHLTHDDWEGYRDPEHGAAIDSDPFTIEELVDWQSASSEIDFEASPSSGLERRLLTESRTRYWVDDLDPLSPFAADGTMESRALVYQKYVRAYTSGLLSDIYATDVSTADLEAAGYVDLDEDGHYWVASGTQTLDDALFYVATECADPFGEIITITWDSWGLFPLSVLDPLSNLSVVEMDPVTLQPSTVTDANGNVTEAIYDALGRLTAIVMAGDSAAAPTTAYTYELDRWRLSQLPSRVHVQARTEYGGSTVLNRYTYSDGGGNVVQEKVSAEAGEVNGVYSATRWAGTGRTVLNNKALPVKQFEPFFSTTYECEFEDEMVAQGVSSTIYYDPLGRAKQVDLPNGTLRRVSFTPWEQSFEDENDTILESDWYAEKSTSTASAEDQEAAAAAASHADTPSTVHLDAMGRPYQTDEVLNTSTTLETVVTLDVVGNATSVLDARGITTAQESYDMLGRPMRSISPDAGTTRALFDVSGQAVRVLKDGDLLIETSYDALRRRTTVTVTEGGGSPSIREVNEYGEDAPSPTSTNHRGRLWRQWDTAGRVVFDEYDLQGNALSVTRRFWDRSGTGTDTVSWASTPDAGDLETTEYTVSQTWDALNRMTSQTPPDGKVTEYTYNNAGLLETVAVDSVLFVSALSYNARGQRESVTYGSGVVTDYTYDPETYRLRTLVTTGAGSPSDLQALEYWYDPVGNITRINNTGDTGGTLYFANVAVTANQTFVYDALYRLSEATGRERQNLGYVAPGDEPAFGNRPDANTAVQAYTQSFAYDEVGNITQMSHFVGSGSPYNWTRDYTYATDSNRLEQTDVGANTDLFAHDDRGNLSYLPHLLYSATQDANVEVDFRDQMVRANLQTSGQYALYYYDSSGQRTRKVVVRGSTVEERRYVGGYEIWTRTIGGSLDDERSTLHVMDGQQRVAMIEEKTGGSGSTWERVRYQLGNHLGTSVLEVDDSGAIISYEEYHPFGTTAWQAPELSTVSAKRYRYTGKEKDEETGLYYHGARYYAPWLGRWTAADPIGMGDGVNRYAYCHCNPVARSDPTGLGDSASTTTDAQFIEVPRCGMDPLRVYSDDFVGPLPNDAMRASDYARIVNSDKPLVKTSFTGPIVGIVAEPAAEYIMDHTLGGLALQSLAASYPDEAADVAETLDSIMQSEIVLAAEDVPLLKLGTSLLTAGAVSLERGMIGQFVRREITTLTNKGAKIAAAEVLAAYNTESVFSGVWNRASGQFLMIPSEGASLKSGEAIQTVSRRGGHGVVEQQLMEMVGSTDRSMNVGFTVKSMGGNKVSIDWTSGVVNRRNFGVADRLAPEVYNGVRLRDEVVRSLEAAGLEVVQ